MTSYQRWGPFLVVVPKSQILSWTFTFEHHCPDLRVLPYWGSASDRSLLRSYMTSEDLYTARAGMHIVVTSYNIMQCDVEHLRQVHWQLLVLDEPFSVLSNAMHTAFCDDLLSLSCRQLLLTCSRLTDNTGHLPSMRAVVSAIYPAILDLLLSEMDEDTVRAMCGCLGRAFREYGLDAFALQNDLDPKTARLLRRLISSLTVVHDPAVPPSLSDEVLTEPKELSRSLSQLAWFSIEHQAAKDGQPVQYVFKEPRETESFEDEDVQDELTRELAVEVPEVKKKKTPRAKGKRAKSEGGGEHAAEAADGGAGDRAQPSKKQKLGSGEAGGVKALPNGRYEVLVPFQGHLVSIGEFESAEEAAQAYSDAMTGEDGDEADTLGTGQSDDFPVHTSMEKVTLHESSTARLERAGKC